MQELANTIYSAFLMPSDVVLSTIGIIDGERSVVMLVTLSLFAWFLLAVAGLIVLQRIQNAARNAAARVRTMVFRMSRATRRLKTKLVLKLRELVPRKAFRRGDETSMVEFDDLDLAVLRSAAARGPGFTTSAPEIAEQLTMRPAQIQCSLDKLNKNKMLEYVIGSTDGFDNYRLSRLGTSFVGQWQRHGAAS